MLWRIGTVLLIPLLFAEWTDNLMAEFLPPEAIPLVTPPDLQLAIVTDCQNEYGFNAQPAALPYSQGIENSAWRDANSHRMPPDCERPQPSGTDLLYLMMSQQE